MHWLSCLVVTSLLTATVWSKDPPDPAGKGLSVHEWGVFRVNEDAEFANADLRAVWDDLPEFAYGQIKGRTVPQHWGAAEVRKQPILFFHAEKPVQVRVKIEFPGGMPGVWFPATESPAVEGLQRQPAVGSSLEWNLAVKQCPVNWRPKTLLPPEAPATHWINRLRQVRADEVFARFSPNHLDVEREKFVYYDGIFPQKKWIKIKIEKDRLSLTSQVKHPLFDVTIVDRRSDKSIRVGRLARLDNGESNMEVVLAAVEDSRFVPEATKSLVKQLMAAGLFDDEAKSLADIWKHDMFETPGLTLFYRLPQSEYDALMPLTITPKPETTVRVGLVYHAHLEPDFAERVLGLVKQLDAARFSDRDAATKKLMAIGPAALVQLQRLRDRTDLSLEVRERIGTLVKKWSVKEAFER